MRKPMIVSPGKLEANRRNAQKSTGPKTADGKAVSKLNALKHAVLAQSVVVRGQQCKESPRQFKQLCREFYAHLAPTGPLEEMLVNQIIQASWRLRRARLAESGEIALSVDEGHWKRQHIHPQRLWALWEVWGDPVWAMENSATGNSLLADWLREVRAKVEAEGELTDAAIKIPLHGKPNKLAQALERLRLDCLPPPEGADPAASRKETKTKLLAGIDKMLLDLNLCRRECCQKEHVEERSLQSAAVLPSEETLEKILHYEAALERQIYRAMNQLERLQRRRQGEIVPAPMTMELSARP